MQIKRERKQSNWGRSVIKWWKERKWRLEMITMQIIIMIVIRVIVGEESKKRRRREENKKKRDEKEPSHHQTQMKQCLRCLRCHTKHIKKKEYLATGSFSVNFSLIKLLILFIYLFFRPKLNNLLRWLPKSPSQPLTELIMGCGTEIKGE